MNDIKLAAITQIINLLVFGDPIPEENIQSEPLVCHVQNWGGPNPLGGKNRCGPWGAYAAILNRRAAGLNARGNKKGACKAVNNYLMCGYPLKIDNKNVCIDLARTFTAHGVSATSIDCE